MPIIGWIALGLGAYGVAMALLLSFVSIAKDADERMDSMI